MTDGEERLQYKNIVAGDAGLVTSTAVATKLGLFTVTGAAIVLACVSCEIGKQVSNYSINYYNGGRYPLPQTLLVSVLRTSSSSPSPCPAAGGGAGAPQAGGHFSPAPVSDALV